jgi:hypothetical protein
MNEIVGKISRRIHRLKTRLMDRNLLRNAKQRAWLRALAALETQEVVALETGRIRNPAWKHSDGNSTDFLTRLKRVKKLASIDNDSENFSGYSSSRRFCEGTLSPQQIAKIDFHDGNSVDVIKALPKKTKFNFVLLDSANDPDLIFREFEAVFPLMDPKQSILVVDDVTLPGIKGDKLIPYLKTKGFVEHRCKAEPSDCSYFIFRDLAPAH